MRALSILLCSILALAISTACGNAAEQTLESLTATRNRPLFSPTRRPPPPPPQVPSPPVTSDISLPPPPPRVELTGIILGPNQRMAILERLDDQKPQSVHLGADVDGWQVTSITSRSIVLNRAGQSVELHLPLHRLGENDGN